MQTSLPRQPSLFVSHGAPTFALEPGLLGPRLTALGQALPRPRAVVLVSPHWMTPTPRVGSGRQPETVHDFGGFPPALYQLQYPAPGAPEVAARALALLAEAGWQPHADEGRGYDHGAWVPMRFLFPDADVPLVQVSLPQRIDAAGAWALGRALAPLRDEGVLVVGSGSLTHNLYEFRGTHGDDAPYAQAFAKWVAEAVLARDDDRLLHTLERAPHAERAHPTAEHFWPLLVAAGAADAGAPATVLEGGITYGVLSMDSYLFGAVQ